jgi:hypothetical protein
MRADHAAPTPSPATPAPAPNPPPTPRPAIVLDPFGGTGTTALVAKALGRHGITVDMSADYCRLAEWRTNDRNQLAKVLGGRSRIRSITRARHAVAWTMRRQGKSFRDIGDALGLDHSSALHAYNKVEKSPGVRALLISQLDDPTARTGA